MSKDKSNKDLQPESLEELKNLQELGNGYFLADIENEVSSPIKIPNKNKILPIIKEEENESPSPVEVFSRDLKEEENESILQTSSLESDESSETQNLSRSSSSEDIFRMSEEEIPQNSFKTTNSKKANNKNNQNIL